MPRVTSRSLNAYLKLALILAYRQARRLAFLGMDVHLQVTNHRRPRKGRNLPTKLGSSSHVVPTVHTRR
jgi:hypothetical protein